MNLKILKNIMMGIYLISLFSMLMSLIAFIFGCLEYKYYLMLYFKNMLIIIVFRYKQDNEHEMTR